MCKMCKKLVFLVLFLTLAGAARADTLFHWTFDGGTPGEAIESDTDIASGEVAYAFVDEDGVGDANGLFYAAGNPFFNTAETCADFQNDPATNNAGYGLAVLDGGVDSPVDLSTLSACTIEAFCQPYALRQCIIIRKNNSPSGGGIYFIDTRPGGQFAVRLAGPNGDIGDDDGVCNDLTYQADEWYHVALIWDGSDVTFWVNGQQSQNL
ncbi:MAG: LamG-like jellyroll fold domain-containing protein, partial [Planctomycetota bacterium]